jgi:diguanylate cyclase (GGDEF)-like protein/PAS domain S-box-containing protein
MDLHPTVCFRLMATERLTFVEQLKLQRLRRFEEENARQDRACQDHLRLLETAMECSQDAVVITEGYPMSGSGPRIQYVNPAFTQLTGFTAQDVVGSTPRMLQGPMSEPASLLAIREGLKSRQAISVEVTNHRKDRSTFLAHLAITPMVSEGGDVQHWIGVIRDISAIKQSREMTERAEAVESQNQKLSAEIAERKDVEERLAYAAFHDSLTGLKNREYFMERLREALQRACSRPDYQSYLIYLDLDGFKRVNDVLGHSVGDLVLQEAAERLRQACRPQDTLARYGGDEFTILLAQVSTQEAAFSVAQRLLNALNQPFASVSEGYTISGSFGLCQIQARYENAEDILHDADAAMYRAKEQGGAQCVWFDAEMHARAMSLQRETSRLRDAVQHEEFALRYQPVVDMRTRRMVSVEALLRWPGVDESMSPDKVITLAEQAGMMARLGAWILRRGAKQLLQWREVNPASTFTLSFNISGRQLEAPDFLTRFQDFVSESGVEYSSLQLEVTEAVMLRNSEQNMQLLQELRRLGVRVALDDFGVDYGSLSYLERYPIDTLKIDRSFIKGVGEDRARTEMVRTIIQVSRQLGLRTVAEGVEETAQEHLLQTFGCYTAQGFLYSAPCTAQEIREKWLATAY